MSRTTLTLRLERTDTFDLQVTKDGVPYDITGCLVVVACKRVLDRGETAFFTVSVGDGLTVTEALAGKFRIECPPAKKTGMRGFISAWWETRLTLLNGAVVTPDGLEGPVVIEPSALDAT